MLLVQENVCGVWSIHFHDQMANQELQLMAAPQHQADYCTACHLCGEDEITKSQCSFHGTHVRSHLSRVSKLKVKPF